MVTTPATEAPATDDPVFPELPPKNPPPPLPELLPEGLISTPRKAVSPMCTVVEDDPASMALAMLSAGLIGMA